MKHTEPILFAEEEWDRGLTGLGDPLEKSRAIVGRSLGDD